MHNVRELTYFGNVSAKDWGASEGINTHVKKANEVFVQLHALRMATCLSKLTKLRICNNNVKVVVLYGYEICKESRIVCCKPLFLRWFET
jgi:hypothetical protein